LTMSYSSAAATAELPCDPLPQTSNPNQTQRRAWRYQPPPTSLTESGNQTGSNYATTVSDAARRFEADLRRVARFPYSILINGETGTGKTWAARRIHQLSSRATRPFLELNCANLPENLVEAELFGYRKGAFTGADRDHKGLFEEADGGFLFLDEIGDLAPAVQTKLLKAIEEKQFKRLGTNRYVSCDVQIIAATSRDLPEMVRRGQFRADLYSRLAVLTLAVAPLRERPEDIPALLDFYLREAARAIGRSAPFLLEEGAASLLCAYDYPGNIRTLRNLIYELTSYVEENEPVSFALAAATLAKQLTYSEPAANGEPLNPVSTAQPAPGPGITPPWHRLAQEGDIILPAEVCLIRRGETFNEWLARAKRCSIQATLEANGGALKNAAERLGLTHESLKGHWYRARVCATGLFPAPINQE
jgi:transcriptional regulator with GAF, ATPase, and Fis domain